MCFDWTSCFNNIHASNAPLSMKRLMNLGIHEADILDVVIGVIHNV